MKQKGIKNLTLTQRLQLEVLLKTKMHKKDIAKTMGLCLATIYNEIKRGAYQHLNGGTWQHHTAYSPELAQKRYEYNQTSKGAPLKIGNDWNFVHYVENSIIKEGLSPHAIAGRLKRKQPSNIKTIVSKQTLYRYIQNGIFLNVSMKQLPFGERKKRYKKTVIKRPPKGISIEKRPDYINNRSEFGHWEMDCICGSTTDSLLILTERLTRQEIIYKISNQKSESVVNCLNKLERKFGKKFRKVFKSITVDNGSEFSKYEDMQRSIYRGKRTSIYYCHPYSAYERGSNERLNREIRRKIPKGSNLSKYSAEEIQHIENWVNNYPRGILNFATSNEIFSEYLARI